MTCSLRPALMAGAAVLCLLPLAGPARAGTAEDHATAQAALADLRAARTAVVGALDSYEADPSHYREAAQRAANMLAGERDPAYSAAAGVPDDAVGAVGRLDALLNRTDAPVWADAVRGAEVNARAAVARLQTAAKAHELGDFQIAATEAVDSLLVAEGRSTSPDVFGGLLGALGTTVLGVPLGVNTVDACSGTVAAGWAVHGGRLGFVALAPGTALPALDTPLGVTAVAGTDELVVLRTAAWPLVQQDCLAPATGRHAEAPPATGGAPAAVAATQHAAAAQAPAAAPAATAAAAAPAADNAPFPALYTEAQAEAGKAVYAENCVSCHGADMHGLAAPAIAGTEFLSSAADNSWSLEAIRTIVFTMMPLNAGGSLSTKQYAEVTAFILASNCLPAGATPFPEDDSPELDKVQLHPLAAPPANRNALGVCPVG
ncbi:MAG: c-type cytochrome [Janthinobacterium lividum]